MKDAKGHGSDARGGVSSLVTAVKALVNMIRPPAAHQEGIRQGVPSGGLYYKNIGEDVGSVSAVVPNKTFLRRAS